MRFRISGADRETGEDIELLVEAETTEEATAKGNRRGILVDQCIREARATHDGVTAKSPQPPAASTSPVKPPERPTDTWAKRLLIYAAILTVACVGIWYGIIKPRDEASRKAIDGAVEQDQKFAAKDAELAKLEYLRFLAKWSFLNKYDGDAANKFEKIVTSNVHTLQGAIANDPIMSPVVRDTPGLYDAMLSRDTLDVWSFLQTVPDDRMSADDKRYVQAFHAAAKWLSH